MEKKFLNNFANNAAVKDFSKELWLMLTRVNYKSAKVSKVV